MMVNEFEDYNNSKMIYALNIIDERKLSDVTIDLDSRLEITNSLSYVIFFNYFKHPVDTNNKQVDEYSCLINEILLL